MEPKDRQTQPDARSQHRAYVLDHVVAGSLTLDQAAKVLGLSTRQVNRLIARHADVQRRSPTAIGAGRRSIGSMPPVGPTSSRSPGRRTPRSTTPTWPSCSPSARGSSSPSGRSGGSWPRPRSVRPGPAARHVTAAAASGCPARANSSKVDGSKHRWFGSDRPFATLVAGIDDATGRVPGGTFRAQEDAVGYLTTFAQTAERHGLPGAVYSDRHGIFLREPGRAPTLAEQLTGKHSFTQVGRALDEAGIGWIGARSPQAKGRVERLWGTLQDRLVTELRLAGITTIEAANAFLSGFLDRHNARFSVPAADPVSAWRAVPDGVSPAAVFCFHYPRRVANDATISWPGDALALPRRRDGRSWAGRLVIVQERLDGSLWVSHDGRCVPVRPAPPDAGQLRARNLRGRRRIVICRPRCSSSPKPRSYHWRRRRATLPGDPAATTPGAAIGTVIDDRIAGRRHGESGKRAAGERLVKCLVACGTKAAGDRHPISRLPLATP